MSPRERILVVDDDASQRMLVSRLLTDQGFHVDTAEEGTKSLTLAESNSYDLVVLDFRMPGLNGVELFERLSALQPGLRGIIVTAHASLGTVYPAVCAGIQRVLAKPVHAEELFAVVEQLLSGSPPPHQGNNEHASG